jgi:hypothetical protein
MTMPDDSDCCPRARERLGHLPQSGANSQVPTLTTRPGSRNRNRNRSQQGQA